MAAQEGSFGYPIDAEIVKQLSRRGEAFASDSKSIKRELPFIYGNAPWIMLRSGVDTPVPGSDKTSADEAKRYVLVGGQAFVSESGFYTARGLENLSSTDLPAYRNSSIMGYRPIPGITGINVKAKDTWGAIMEAEVSFQVWSREDMEVIDRLFFKPGMTALLEWGHTVWIDNEGKLQKTGVENILASSEFFVDNMFDDIDEEVQKRRKSCDGNYEACFGYITNFSYSFNSKGGYDCTLKLLSKNSVLEGLKIARSLEQKPEEESNKSKKDKKGKKKETEAYVSEYHRIFQPLIGKSADGRAYRRVLRCWSENSGINWGEFPWKGREILKLLEVTLYPISLKCNNLGWFLNALGWNDSYVHTIYLSLRDLLKIIQAVNNDTLEDGNKSQSKVRKYFEFDLESENEYVTFREHFSLNPYVANMAHQPSMAGSYTLSDVLPDPANTECLDSGVLGEFVMKVHDGDESDSSNITTFADHPQDLDDGTKVKGYQKILNIVVSANHFLGIVDSIISSETEDFSIYDAITTLLGDIQKAFGNVNSFGLHYNHAKNLWSIVDHNCPALKDFSSDKKDHTIVVSGLKTTVTNLSVNSAVSPSIANEMAIAAQAPSPQSQEASPSIVNWNEGCVTRHHLPELASGSVSLVAPEQDDYITGLYIRYKKDPLTDFIIKTYNFYKSFNEQRESTGDSDIEQFAEERYQEIQLHGEGIFARCVNRDVNSDNPSKYTGALHTGVIPVKVELDMLGISRFVVGTTFKISPGILLPKYDDWGYIVTGVENKVDANGWRTHLKTQYYPIIKKKKGAEAERHITPTSTYVPDTYEDYPYTSGGTLYLPSPETSYSTNSAGSSGGNRRICVIENNGDGHGYHEVGQLSGQTGTCEEYGPTFWADKLNMSHREKLRLLGLPEDYDLWGNNCLPSDSNLLADILLPVRVYRRPDGSLRYPQEIKQGFGRRITAEGDFITSGQELVDQINGLGEGQYINGLKQRQRCHIGIRRALNAIFTKLSNQYDFCGFGLGGSYTFKKWCHGIGCAIDLGNGGFHDYKPNPWFNRGMPVDVRSGYDSNGFGRNSQDPGMTSCYRYYNPRYSIWDWDHPVVALFRSYGFGWGGAYGDVMHFSLFTDTNNGAPTVNGTQFYTGH